MIPPIASPSLNRATKARIMQRAGPGQELRAAARSPRAATRRRERHRRSTGRALWRRCRPPSARVPAASPAGPAAISTATRAKRHASRPRRTRQITPVVADQHRERGSPRHRPPAPRPADVRGTVSMRQASTAMSWLADRNATSAAAATIASGRGRIGQRQQHRRQRQRRLDRQQPAAPPAEAAHRAGRRHWSSTGDHRNFSE